MLYNCVATVCVCNCNFFFTTTFYNCCNATNSKVIPNAVVKHCGLKMYAQIHFKLHVFMFAYFPNITVCKRTHIKWCPTVSQCYYMQLAGSFILQVLVPSCAFFVAQRGAWGYLVSWYMHATGAERFHSACTVFFSLTIPPHASHFQDEASARVRVLHRQILGIFVWCYRIGVHYCYL